MAYLNDRSYPEVYWHEQKLRDIVAAEGIIREATTVQEMQAALLTVCNIMKYDLTQSVAEDDRMFAVRR